MIAYTLTNNSITVVLNNKVYTVSNGQSHWEPVLDAIRQNDKEKLYSVLSVANTIVTFTEGNVTVKDNQVFYRNIPLDNYVVDKVLEFSKNKLPLQPILRFINNLMKNPSRRAVQELYKFLEHKNMPITPDGNFLAYKGVQSDYYSKTAGTIIVIKGKVQDGKIYNGIGEEIEVERNGVCDDKNLGCSSGLHAGSVNYATDFGRGGRVVIVEINPADVVSVPDDCNCQKLRACRYKVVGEYEVPLDNNYNNSYSNEDWNDDDDDDGDDWNHENNLEEDCGGSDDIHTTCESVNYQAVSSTPITDEIQKMIDVANENIKKKLEETENLLREFSKKLDVSSDTNVVTKDKNPLEKLREALDIYYTIKHNK